MSAPPVAPQFDGTQPCAKVDPELFFPTGGNVDRPISLCGDCPFKEPCLAYALKRSIRFGIWGGTTEDQRKAMRRRFRNLA